MQSRYYNPDWCRFINADDIAQNEINLFSYCYNNAVNMTDYTGNKPKERKLSFIIFSSKSFELESVLICLALKKTYKTSYGSVSVVTKGKDFIREWNELEPPDLVVLNYHGNPSEIGPINKSNIGKLEYKKIKTLVVLGCNCAHQSKKWSNICVKFTKIISGYVVGSDGTVCVIINGSIPDKTWREIEESNNGTRKTNAGWIIYWYNKDERKIRCKPMNRWTLTIPGVLDYLHKNLSGKKYTKK